MTKVLGNWKLASNDDKFEEYLKTVGVSYIARKIGVSITTYDEITQTDDVWVVKIISTFKTAHMQFRLGEEFDEVTMEGRPVKSTFVVEDDKLVHHQKATKAGGVSSRITRERLDDETMTLTLEALDKNVVAVQTFKRNDS